MLAGGNWATLPSHYTQTLVTSWEGAGKSQLGDVSKSLHSDGCSWTKTTLRQLTFFCTDTLTKPTAGHRAGTGVCGIEVGRSF